ncbi:uncharacterized protein HMPREF1541_08684 [Cyphellophora europaea CBS 101466]|uniref:Transcription factor domain-containing protein n=1 Tax=Cyphellophora europaea (strain CBS 101466) TaxID=1220924 RepID=W2RIV4_CYPE1|nr:uncharacterized protein HMPREF1541_08684 [Cyphellophora europaea CBS 101466]ETN36407.1 hypothetical protein HMPREF1541_08684 [Cyphellophora europaea CBS 101466]
MATFQIPTPARTPTSPPESSTRVKKKQATSYKAIKFKPWKPAGSPRPHDKARGGTHKWRLDRDQRQQPRLNQRIDDDVSALDEEDAQPVVNTKYSYALPSPLQRLPQNGHRQDPFVILPLEATPFVTSSLDFFLATCVPENRNSEWLVGRPNPHMALLFPFMLKNAMLFETITTLCQGSILLSQGKKVEDDQAFVYHRAHAMKTITQNLTSSDGLSDASILSVAMILTLEYLLGNVAAVAAHLSGIQRMAEMRKDLDGSTPWKRFVKAGIVAYQSLGSFITGEPMSIPGSSGGFVKEAFVELELDKPLAYPRLPFSPELCTVLARLPSGFAEMSLSGNISQQTMKFIAFTNATTSYRESQDTFDERLDHEVHIMLSALQRMSMMQATTIERHLYCGLLAYAFQLRQLRPLNLFHDPQLRDFIRLLRNHEKPDSARGQELMVWISIAAAGALNLRIIALPGSSEVLDRMFQLYPSATSWSYVEPLLKSYFWTTKIGEHWNKCWAAGLERWRKIEKRVTQPMKVELVYPGNAIAARTEEDGEESVSYEAMMAHHRGAVYSIASMMEAARKCPFQSRLGPSIEGAHRMIAQPTDAAASEG